MKIKPVQQRDDFPEVIDTDEVELVKDENANEIEIDALQVMHTPMGTTVKVADFKYLEQVKTSREIQLDDVTIPADMELTVFGIMSDDMYDLLGPNGLRCKLHASDIKKI